MKQGIGILGWAHGHIGIYLEEMKKFEDAEAIASWDHDHERNEKNAAQFGCNAVHSLAAILGDPAIQSVIITSETSWHADLCVEAAKAGKAIALQKPMALTLEDCDRIIDAVRENKVPFTMLWQMRMDPQNQKMREMLQTGALGKVVMFRRKHCLSTHTWPDFDKMWHAKRELNRGMWMDDAAHPFDLVLWLFGKPKSVIAEIDTLLNPNVPDDNGIAIFRGQDGMIIEVCSSFTANAGEATTEIHGDKGTLIQAHGDAVTLHCARRSQGPSLSWLMNGQSEWIDSGILSPTSHADRLRALTRPMVDFFLGKGEPIATLRDGRDNIEMLLASYESALTGKRVMFPFG